MAVAAAKSLQSRLTLCDPTDGNPPGSPVPGILQARILEWVARRLQPTRLLCPWNFSGKNTRVGCHSLLQGISLTQGSNLHLLHLLHWQTDSLPLSYLGSLWHSWADFPLFCGFRIYLRK